MDNLTHTLAGLMLARVGLEKTTPRGAAMLMLAANAPDLDAVVWFSGTLRYIEFHRTYTHSLVFLPLMALLPILLVRAKLSWTSYLASMAAVLSHLLLDWTNAYGIPLLYPLSAHRFSLDITNIFDIWIWVILLGAVAAPALVGLVNGEIGAAKNTGARRGWAWLALGMLVTYEAARVVTHERAVSVVSARLYEGAPPRRVMALPNATNPFTWRGVIWGPGFVVIAPVDLLGEYDPMTGPGAGRLYRTAAPVPEMDAALRTPAFQVFTRWSQAPFWKVTPVEDGLRLDLLDLRFGTPDRPGFTHVSAFFDRAGNVLRAGFGI
jgi:inner membrane protein